MKELVCRKDDHIALSLGECCRSAMTNGFERCNSVRSDFQISCVGSGHYRFEHNALPEIDFSKIDTSLEFLGKRLGMPMIISSITGGSDRGVTINQELAQLAEQYKIGFAVGSQRIAIENKDLKSFDVRKYAPNSLLFANLGAVQLNYGYGVDQCRAAVDMLRADALMLHLNPLQEVFQENGNTNFSGLLKKIERVCKSLEVPVITKEIGYGISSSVAKKLYDVGVKIVDVAGAGSISWSHIEAMRNSDVIAKEASEAFKDWGNPTAYVIEDIAENLPQMTIIASGGIDNGVTIAKALCLGASLCGNASVFLKKITESREVCENFIKTLHFELKTAMFCVGAENISKLKKIKLIRY